MPVMDGVEAFHQIRAYEKENNLPKIPVIAVTANAIKGDKEKFLSLGMDGYVSKPINTDELKSLFDTFIGSKMIHEEDEVIIEVKEEITISKNTNSIVIDESKVAAKLGVSENIAKLIITKFKAEIEKDLEELTHFMEENDVENISHKAHYIKNSCLNVALDEVCEILQQLEDTSLNIDEKKKLFNNLMKLILQIL